MTPRDPFARLQSAIAVTPSPQFAAEVRARVAAAPTSRPWTSVWMFGAIAAAATVVVTVSVVRSRTLPTPVEIPSVASAHEPVAPKAASSTPPTERVSPSRSAPHVAMVAVKLPAVAVDSFYEVIVPDDQRIALERLLAAMRAGRASVPRAAVTTEVDEEGNTLIAPLPGIVPIKIELLADTLAEIKREDIKKEQR